jgi:hypothetical protein
LRGLDGDAAAPYSPAMNPALLADLVAAVHLAIVVFMIAGQAAILAGWALGWSWIRSPWFRFAHLAIMAYIAFNAVRGELCFLTHIEFDLRREAGQQGAEGSFVGQLLHDILFVDMDQGVLNGIYLAFFAVVLACLVGAPPRRRVS